jgi:hypothetical protein
MARHYKLKYEKATSAPVKGYISHAKNVLRQLLRIINRFVDSHLLSIEEELKIARSLQVNKNQEYKSKNDIKSNNSSDMIYSNLTNKEIDINSNVSNNVESEFYSDDDISSNSD